MGRNIEAKQSLKASNGISLGNHGILEGAQHEIKKLISQQP